MKKIKIVFTEEIGEVEGVFDENDVLLGAWSCNDACWREYFNSFMFKLGIKIEDGRSPTESQMKKLKKYFGEE